MSTPTWRERLRLDEAKPEHLVFLLGAAFFLVSPLLALLHGEAGVLAFAVGLIIAFIAAYMQPDREDEASMTQDREWPPTTEHTPLLGSELVAELMPLNGEGHIAKALNSYVRAAERYAWQCGLQRAQQVVRCAGLPDEQTAALIDELGSCLDEEIK